MPVVVYDYPSSFKPFYMRLNESSKYDGLSTVANMDVLVPEIGEVVGGSQREERKVISLLSYALSAFCFFQIFEISF